MSYNCYRGVKLIKILSNFNEIYPETFSIRRNDLKYEDEEHAITYTKY